MTQLDVTSTTSSGVQLNKDSSAHCWANPPSRLELVLLVLLSCVLFVSLVSLFRNYFDLVDNFGDSSAYMNVANAIRHWHFQGLVIKHFWGLPYLMAALSTVTRMSDRSALLLISLASSLAVAILAAQLWGGWVAGFFAILNFDWMQRCFLGGSEPLFMALLLAAFLAARRERWLLAALLASLATIVRPLGLFAVLGIGLTLLWRRNFLKFAQAAGIGLTIGLLYALPLARQFGDPLATVHSYVRPEWEGGWLFGIPFWAIIRGTLIYRAPWTNLVLTFGWIFLVVAAIVAMIWRKDFRDYARSHPVEILFAVPYLWCLFSYNYPLWARGSFPRFSIPILPFVLFALYRWIPKDRRVLWAVGVASSLLAAASAIGVHNVADAVRRAIS
jgi:hypothetical protein